MTGFSSTITKVTDKAGSAETAGGVLPGTPGAPPEWGAGLYRNRQPRETSAGKYRLCSPCCGTPHRILGGPGPAAAIN